MSYGESQSSGSWGPSFLSEDSCQSKELLGLGRQAQSYSSMKSRNIVLGNSCWCLVSFLLCSVLQVAWSTHIHPFCDVEGGPPGGLVGGTSLTFLHRWSVCSRSSGPKSSRALYQSAHFGCKQQKQTLVA